MKEFTYVIKEELGLHARPAGLLVEGSEEVPERYDARGEGKDRSCRQADRHHEHGRQAGR